MDDNSTIDASEDSDENDEHHAETDPTQRFYRFKELIQISTFKEVYRAIDIEIGIEVAWNKIPLNKIELDQDQILKEIEVFKLIRHRNIIELYHFWKGENQVVFITELLPSGTLFTYIEKQINIRLKFIKRWCIQILQGLQYLHTRDPPIIHRDIRCNNIYINGLMVDGGVKIGDLGLTTFSKRKESLSVIGNPNFMAPEYYSSSYSTGVDIWAFGMTVIEMITRIKPYDECKHIGEIITKVTSGIFPLQFDGIQNSDVRDFISLCFKPEKDRPTATELLEHSFLLDENENDNIPISFDENIYKNKLNEPTEPCLDKDFEIPKIGVPIPSRPECNIEVIMLNTMNEDPNIISMKLRIDTEEEKIEIAFDYNVTKDKANVVAKEMCDEMSLDKATFEDIRDLIQEQVQILNSIDSDDIGSPIVDQKPTPIIVEKEKIKLDCQSSTLPKPSIIIPYESSIPGSNARDIEKQSSGESTGSYLAMHPEFLADRGVNSPLFTEPPKNDSDDTYLEQMESLLDSSEEMDDDKDTNSSRENLFFDLEEPDESEKISNEEEIANMLEKHEQAKKLLIAQQKRELKELEEKQKKRRLARKAKKNNNNNN